MMKNEYDKLLDVILSDSKEEKSALENIFIESEKHHSELEEERNNSEELHSNIPKTDLSALKYFLPKKVREEFVGDMYELVTKMEKEKRNKHFIWFIIVLQYIFVILGQLKSIVKITINREIVSK